MSTLCRPRTGPHEDQWCLWAIYFRGLRSLSSCQLRQEELSSLLVEKSPKGKVSDDVSPAAVARINIARCFKCWWYIVSDNSEPRISRKRDWLMNACLWLTKTLVRVSFRMSVVFSEMRHLDIDISYVPRRASATAPPGRDVGHGAWAFTHCF